MSAPMKAIWHDLECGTYAEDLSLWRALAERCDGPVLDVGAGTGRTTLALAAEGYDVTAIDLDDELLEQLRYRAGGLEVTALVADARAFWLGREFALGIVPMQTIQLLGGPEGRAAFLSCARDHLVPGSRLAIAIAEDLECFETAGGGPGPLPDVTEIDGIVYCSRPTAIREDGDGWVLERRRETVTIDGQLSSTQDLIHLDRLDPATLESEGTAAGLRPVGRVAIPPTADYAGSTVVVFSV
jgi:SAM-dependent methyltransferase